MAKLSLRQLEPASRIACRSISMVHLSLPYSLVRERIITAKEEQQGISAVRFGWRVSKTKHGLKLPHACET
ncbi:hypothetical protein CU669_19925 [Paramagnetospirillum kuznetsovii]|uniref:Uncharacterized protein n=1 Tax=Paramagnetospirillum kuznetsovii TaxID=2053833 RepID=A0A364NT17_9PROT|nr:hypothetical protein CU669_19925 [Paramagnetospirillum kuznetsovii]